MSDDLVKRLWLYDCEGITREAADRIEELEAERDALRAKLAKAVKGLEFAATALNRVAWGGDFTCFIDAEWGAVNDALDQARATLALMEDTDDE